MYGYNIDRLVRFRVTCQRNVLLLCVLRNSKLPLTKHLMCLRNCSKFVAVVNTIGGGLPAEAEVFCSSGSVQSMGAADLSGAGDITAYPQRLRSSVQSMAAADLTGAGDITA
jgi:hypothetical protein